MSEKINWRQKLSSRKFWSMVSAVIVCVLKLLKAEQEVIVEVTSLVGAISAVVIYILAEAYVDGKRVEGATIVNVTQPQELKVEQPNAVKVEQPTVVNLGQPKEVE